MSSFSSAQAQAQAQTSMGDKVKLGLLKFASLSRRARKRQFYRTQQSVRVSNAHFSVLDATLRLLQQTAEVVSLLVACQLRVVSEQQVHLSSFALSSQDKARLLVPPGSAASFVREGSLSGVSRVVSRVRQLSMAGLPSSKASLFSPYLLFAIASLNCPPVARCSNFVARVCGENNKQAKHFSTFLM